MKCEIGKTEPFSYTFPHIDYMGLSISSIDKIHALLLRNGQMNAPEPVDEHSTIHINAHALRFAAFLTLLIKSELIYEIVTCSR